ncbi:MAG TPA: PDZ domain-containing protein, partial [Saprospiraceae bacterium]|nr:PDZ domain-containing protein [Saprospiraceae bacterium]
MDSRTADEAGLTEVSGVILDRINSGGAADQAGLQSGDIILSIDGEKITSSPDFMGRIGQHHPGDLLLLTYLRSGKTKEARVKLGESLTSSMPDMASDQSPDVILQDIGLTVRDLSNTEAAKLPKEGVMVDGIEKGSPIDQVNMEDHFIITRINGMPVSDVSGLKRELAKSGIHLYLQGYYENFPGDFAYSLSLK